MPLPETLPADDYAHLLDIGAELAGDPHFGLHVGERVKLGTYSVYGLILLSCRDFGQAFEQTMRYEQLAHDLGRSTLTVDDGVARYTWHSNYHASHRHLADSVFAGIRAFGNWLAGATLPAAQLALTHDGGAAANRDEYVRLLGAMPTFGAAANVAQLRRPDAGVAGAERRRQPVPGAAAARRKAAAPARRSQPDIAQQVHAAIVRNLSHGQVRLASIAEELKLSPRTLQRKLNESGATFQQVLDQARFALAKDYLRQPEPEPGRYRLPARLSGAERVQPRLQGMGRRQSRRLPQLNLCLDRIALDPYERADAAIQAALHAHQEHVAAGTKLQVVGHRLSGLGDGAGTIVLAVVLDDGIDLFVEAVLVRLVGDDEDGLGHLLVAEHQAWCRRRECGRFQCTSHRAA
jgi:AraC-like DNA-binding protein